MFGRACQVGVLAVAGHGVPVTTLVNVTTTVPRSAGGRRSVDTVAVPTLVVVFLVYGVVPQSRRNALWDVHGVVDTAKAGAGDGQDGHGEGPGGAAGDGAAVDGGGGGRGEEVCSWVTFQRVGLLTAPSRRKLTNASLWSDNQPEFVHSRRGEPPVRTPSDARSVESAPGIALLDPHPMTVVRPDTRRTT